MIVKVPSEALSVPPLIGASKNLAPAFSAPSAHKLVVFIPTVLWSIRICPFCAFAISPSFPRNISSTVFTSGKHVIITSVCSVISFSEVVGIAPSSVMSLTFC